MKAGFIKDSDPPDKKMQTIKAIDIVSAFTLLSSVLHDGELLIIKYVPMNKDEQMNSKKMT